MSPKDRANRRRWASDQRKRARVAFAATQPTVEEERATKLAELETLAAMMEGQPHMASTLAAVRARIVQLSRAVG